VLGVDLFSGAGGMSLGALQAGIDVVLAVEADRHAAQTYYQNHPDVDLFSDSIFKLDLVALRKVARRRKECVVFGGPPCQGFSYSNQRTRNSSNPSNWLFKEFIRIVKLVRAEWVVFENVKGITDTEGGKFLAAVLRDLDRLGYSLTSGLLNALDFGVPQNRQRLFVIGVLQGATIDLPSPSWSNPITVAEAISDLPYLENGAAVSQMPYGLEAPSSYANRLREDARVSANHLVTRNAENIVERYKHVPPGGNWSNVPSDLMANYKNLEGCHTGLYHRLQWDSPSVVIGNFRKNMLIHPNCNRGLSVREAARIQSFPDKFAFSGSIGFQQQQVGNAVPPLLAHAVFSKLVESVES